MQFELQAPQVLAFEDFTCNLQAFLQYRQGATEVGVFDQQAPLGKVAFYRQALVGPQLLAPLDYLAVDPKQLRGRTFVALATLQRMFHQQVLGCCQLVTAIQLQQRFGEVRPFLRRVLRRLEESLQGGTVDQRALGQGADTVDEVTQLADIARPVPLAQQRRRPGVERQRAWLQAAEVLDQAGNIFAPGVQARQLKLEHGKAVVEVFAKALLMHQRLEVTVGGGDHAPGEVAVFATAQRTVLAGFKHTQQLRLQGQWQLAHFIEKQRARTGHLQVPCPLANGPGECPSRMTEQLRFEQTLGDRPAIEVDERLAWRTQAMQSLGDDFLASPGGATDQHRPVACSYPLHQCM
ncbi:hypothetical protein D3C79_586340 [compost metagenome]